MTAATATMDSEFAQGVTDRQVRAQPIDTDKAREGWAEHMSLVEKGLYKAGGWLQKAAGAVMIGTAPAIVIPGIGQAKAGLELTIYGATSAFQGAIRTNAENKAIEAAGGTAADKGGTSQFLKNTVRELNPFDND